jgi:hypothetical protein
VSEGERMPWSASDSPGDPRGHGDAGQADARPDPDEPQPGPDPWRDRETPAVTSGDDGYVPL